MTDLDTAPAARGIRRPVPPLARDLAILVVLALVLFFVPYFVGAYVLQVGYLVLQLAALGSAWNLLAGYTGMVSLGSAAFIGIGIYAMAQLDKVASVPWLVGFLAGGVLAAAFAAVVSPAMFRLRGLYFTIGTLALSEALRLWMVNSPIFGGASGIFLQSRAPQTYQLYWMVLGAAILATGVVLVVLRLPMALRFNAIRDDEDVAKQMGVFAFRTKLWAFTIAAFLMGVVGSIQALNSGVVEPYGSFGLSWTVDVVMVVIIGGLATRTGPWVGALFAVALEEALKGYAELHLAITGVILLLVIRFAPRGIWGTVIGYAARLRERDARGAR